MDDDESKVGRKRFNN